VKRGHGQNEIKDLACPNKNKNKRANFSNEEACYANNKPRKRNNATKLLNGFEISAQEEHTKAKLSPNPLKASVSSDVFIQMQPAYPTQ